MLKDVDSEQNEDLYLLFLGAADAVCYELCLTFALCWTFLWSWKTAAEWFHWSFWGSRLQHRCCTTQSPEGTQVNFWNAKCPSQFPGSWKVCLTISIEFLHMYCPTVFFSLNVILNFFDPDSRKLIRSTYYTMMLSAFENRRSIS